MSLGIPTFDTLAQAIGAVPKEYAVFEKVKAREYIKARNDFIAFVAATVSRSDMTAEMKVATIAMHPGKGLR